MVKWLSLKRFKKRTYFFRSLNNGKKSFSLWRLMGLSRWSVLTGSLYAVITDSFWNWCLAVLKLSFHLNHKITCSETEPLLPFYTDQKLEIWKSGNLVFFAFHWQRREKTICWKWRLRNNLTSHTLLSFKDNTIINFNWLIFWNTSRTLTGYK